MACHPSEKPELDFFLGTCVCERGEELIRRGGLQPRYDYSSPNVSSQAHNNCCWQCIFLKFKAIA